MTPVKVWTKSVLISAFFVSMTMGVSAEPTSSEAGASRPRARDLGIIVGTYPPGPWNAITDVEGVKVGQITLIQGDGVLVPGKGPVRTGVTVVVPRDDVWHEKVPAGSFVLNGTGEMTGLAWIAESGFLEYPIALTNTLNVPRVANGVMTWMFQQYPEIGISDDTLTPVVAECDDSRLNDSQGRHVTEQHVVAALDGATSGPIEEGTVGAGTGMISYQFKGGIGTASRQLPRKEGEYRVGVLVNANQGRRQELMIAGVPVGRLYDLNKGDSPKNARGDQRSAPIMSHIPGVSGDSGSIIIIIATDAPLDSRQLARLSRRAALGLARTGSVSHHGSGDFILAFSTANIIPHYPDDPTITMKRLADTHLNPILAATVEATEEAIVNALLRATTVVGRDGRRAEAISISRLQEIIQSYPPFPQTENSDDS